MFKIAATGTSMLAIGQLRHQSATAPSHATHTLASKWLFT